MAYIIVGLIIYLILVLFFWSLCAVNRIKRPATPVPKIIKSGRLEALETSSADRRSFEENENRSRRAEVRNSFGESGSEETGQMSGEEDNLHDTKGIQEKTTCYPGTQDYIVRKGGGF